MSNQVNPAFGFIIGILLMVTAWVGSGFIAWNWVEPDSFWGAIKFLFAWTVLGTIGQLISSFLMVVLQQSFKD